MAALLSSEALSEAITPFLLNRSEVTWAPGAATTGSSFKTLTAGAAVPSGCGADTWGQEVLGAHTELREQGGMPGFHSIPQRKCISVQSTICSEYQLQRGRNGLLNTWVFTDTSKHMLVHKYTHGHILNTCVFRYTQTHLNIHRHRETHIRAYTISFYYSLTKVRIFLTFAGTLRPRVSGVLFRKAGLHLALLKQVHFCFTYFKIMVFWGIFNYIFN